MITVTQRGIYRLIETKAQTKILILDGDQIYAWIDSAGIGEILVSSHKKHKADCVLAVGSYRLYNVKKEPRLSDQIHLELGVGMGMWQGYLLSYGLPIDKKKRRIIPTNECITTTEEAFFPESAHYAQL